VSRRRERGLALVAAVSALAVLGVLALGLAHTSVVDQHLARNALAALQADALARSGVAAAAVLLREANAAGGSDTLGAPWARESGRQALGAGWVEVRIEDEARRLPLNTPALATTLPELLRLVGLDPALADAIEDWIDPDDVPRPHGAERDWYRSLAPPCVPRNGPIASLGELALVRGLDKAAVERLRPYLTAAPEPAVNPNTAAREVLLALLRDDAAVGRLLAARARGPLDLAAVLPDAAPTVRQALTDRGQYYTVRAVAGVDELRRGVEATLSAPAGVDPVIVAWRPFVPSAGLGQHDSDSQNAQR